MTPPRCLTHFLPLILAALIAVTTPACHLFSKEQPPIPRSQMEKILLDINLAETLATSTIPGRHNERQKNPDSLAAYYNTVFQHHHITSQQFQASMAWYKQHPDEMDTMLNNMIPTLEKMMKK